MPNNNNNNNMKMPKFNLNWTYMIVILLLAYMFYTNSGNSNSFQKEVSYSEFQEYVQKGYARNIVVNKGDGNVRMYIQKPYVGEIFGKAAEAGRDPSVVAEFPDVSDVNQFLAAEKEAKHFTGKIQYDANSNFLGSLFLNILFPVLLILGFWMLIFRRAGGGGGGIFSVGKSRAQLYEKGSKMNITFNDVAGQDEGIFRGGAQVPGRIDPGR